LRVQQTFEQRCTGDFKGDRTVWIDGLHALRIPRSRGEVELSGGWRSGASVLR
jgi:hypothetical protein